VEELGVEPSTSCRNIVLTITEESAITSDAKHALYQMSYTPYNPLSLLKDLPVYRHKNGGGGELGVRGLAGMGGGDDRRKWWRRRHGDWNMRHKLHHIGPRGACFGLRARDCDSMLRRPARNTRRATYSVST
jgi:hypothetical protein